MQIFFPIYCALLLSSSDIKTSITYSLSTFVRFSVKNPGTSAEILLETARPITNRVDLFEVEKGEIVNSWKNGDAREFDEKAFEHRKSIFPINFEAGEEKSFGIICDSSKKGKWIID